MSESPWFVAHTKPRREKKLVAFCERHGCDSTLPCYETVHSYRGKTVSFQKPLFPGYVFLRLDPQQASLLRQCDDVANLLDVHDQRTFTEQLGYILRALESKAEVLLMPGIIEGVRVRIRSGPLMGLEGIVEQRHGATLVSLRLDFIQQAAAVKVEATQIEAL